MKFKFLFILVLMLIFSIKVSAYESYNVGDEVEYSGHLFRVIEYSGEDDDTILLILKDYVSYDELMELDIENKEQIESFGGF